MTLSVGFAGLGHMGLPMAARLADAGVSLTVWNRTPGRAAPLASGYDALAASAVSSPFLGYKRDAYLADDACPVAFTTALMAKDLELALSLARHADLALPVATAARRSLADACAAGYADADFSCVARLLRDTGRTACRPGRRRT
jgi:3-hydroxyisobutyrate dehydrogenase-like beta-hydroxyacid dehydrogenase